MVDVGQPTEHAQGRFAPLRRQEAGTAPAPWVADGVRIRRRQDNQVAACLRLLGLVSTESGYPLERPLSRREWLTGADVLDAWVAEQDGMVVGHVAITRVDSDPVAAMRWREVTGGPASNLAGVSRLFVRASVRGRGLGTALLETAAEGARARGLTPVAEMVSTSRRGIPLFDGMGWRVVEMYPSGNRRDGLETYLYVAEQHQGM